MPGEERIPVTVLTGYLGAGKTTLLNRILSEDHGRRYAVIVNEFGEIGIDGDLVLNSSEELFEMNNGCICCTVRGDLVRTLHGLLAKREDFDAIIIETTGLADPGPVAQTFFMDRALQSKAFLDSVTVLVDARHIAPRLADSREAAEQVAFADVIVLNKTDLVSEGELMEVEARLRRLNPHAPIHRSIRAGVALDKVLGRGGFVLDRITAPEAACDEPGHVHGEHCGHDHAHDHVHDSDITSVSLASETPMAAAQIGKWLEKLLTEQGQDILRAKGIIDVAGDDRRLVFQAVHMMLEGDFQRLWKPGERRRSVLVFIGRNLNEAALRAGFEACAAGNSETKHVMTGEK
ncbi:MAG: GTP-binding protein [Alphaproteobacteria bacterium]|nr:GTP-binding protein [Alphaproteobacteria bacterium]